MSLAELDRALRLILAGEDEAGLAAYRECLKGDDAFDQPVGTHLLFLERAGRCEAAAEVRRLALQRGVDIAIGARSGAAAQDLAAEYAALVEQGAVNSRMIADFASLLASMGRSDEAAALLDYSHLLRLVPIGDDRLADDIHALILEHEAGSEFQESVQSVRNMSNLRRFHEIAEPAVARLMGALQDEVDSYFAEWRASTHPLARLVPATSRLNAWALVSRGTGHNVPHIHHKGWATGVYYPADLPADAEGGDLVIGSEGPDEIVVRPSAGLLALFPSFYTHRTRPLGGTGLRTSVAFDVIAYDGAGTATCA